MDTIGGGEGAREGTAHNHIHIYIYTQLTMMGSNRVWNLKGGCESGFRFLGCLEGSKEASAVCPNVQTT